MDFLKCLQNGCMCCDLLERLVSHRNGYLSFITQMTIEDRDRQGLTMPLDIDIGMTTMCKCLRFSVYLTVICLLNSSRICPACQS